MTTCCDSSSISINYPINNCLLFSIPTSSCSLRNRNDSPRHMTYLWWSLELVPLIQSTQYLWFNSRTIVIFLMIFCKLVAIFLPHLESLWNVNCVVEEWSKSTPNSLLMRYMDLLITSSTSYAMSLTFSTQVFVGEMVKSEWEIASLKWSKWVHVG